MTKDELIAQIRAAFAGVTLGDGTGLLQGQGFDDYESEIVCQRYREQDEKSDWSAISHEQLERCHSSLSFFNPEGMRFHLPAYMVACLQDDRLMDPVFHLTELSDYGKSKLVLLNPAQRQAIREYLLFLQQTEERYSRARSLIRALANYWTPDGLLPAV